MMAKFSAHAISDTPHFSAGEWWSSGVVQRVDDSKTRENLPTQTELSQSENFYTGIENIMNELLRIREVAKDEGFLEPSGMVIQSAEKVLNKIHAIYPREYDIFPTPDGEISIETPIGIGSSLWCICKPSGQVIFMVYIQGEKQRRKDYDDLMAFPDEFVIKALNDLKARIN